MTKAIFPGSFDPFTVGHESIVRRGLDIFDEIVIAIGVNSDKHSCFSVEQRIYFIRTLFEDKLQVLTYNGLTVDFAKEIGATHILRGLRTSADFEFERAIAQVNKKLSGIDTTFLLTTPEHTPISSSIVRDILRHGGDVSDFVPTPIYNLMKKI
jgi:pantetheine-phosphate adenylyltransferase